MATFLKRFPYEIRKYAQKLIDRFKAPDNMLRHARCGDGTDGAFYVDRKTGEMVGYVAWEGDTVIALEVSEKYRGRGYAERLLNCAIRNGADKLSVAKSNENAIGMYRHLGWKTYRSTDKMLFMRHSEKKSPKKR